MTRTAGENRSQRRSTDDAALTDRLPLAVYGTLRSGFGNHGLLAGRIHRVAAGLVSGYELVVDRIPYARRRPGGRLVVEVVWPTPAMYDRVLSDVDHLEGYDPHGDPADNLYQRVAVTVTVGPHDNVRAWLYEMGRLGASLLSPSRSPVPSGDYADAGYR